MGVLTPENFCKEVKYRDILRDPSSSDKGRGKDLGR